MSTSSESFPSQTFLLVMNSYLNPLPSISPFQAHGGITDVYELNPFLPRHLTNHYFNPLPSISPFRILRCRKSAKFLHYLRKTWECTSTKNLIDEKDK